MIASSCQMLHVSRCSRRDPLRGLEGRHVARDADARDFDQSPEQRSLTVKRKSLSGDGDRHWPGGSSDLADALALSSLSRRQCHLVVDEVPGFG